MTKAIKGGGLRPAPQYLLPQECSWQTLPAKETGTDHDLEPPCGKDAYWVMGCFLEARFYCKKHGQILWNRHHRYRKEHSRRKGANNAIRGKEKGKQVRGSEHTNEQSQGNTHKPSSSGKAEKVTRGNQARVATN